MATQRGRERSAPAKAENTAIFHSCKNTLILEVKKLTETEKRLEDTLLNAIEKWAEYGCATAEGMQALAAAAQVVVNLERG